MEQLHIQLASRSVPPEPAPGVASALTMACRVLEAGGDTRLLSGTPGDDDWLEAASSRPKERRTVCETIVGRASGRNTREGRIVWNFTGRMYFLMIYQIVKLQSIYLVQW